MKVDLTAESYSDEEAEQYLKWLCQRYLKKQDDSLKERLTPYLTDYGFLGMVIALEDIIQSNSMDNSVHDELNSLWKDHLRREPFPEERRQYEKELRFLRNLGRDKIIERLELAKEMRGKAKSHFDSGRYTAAEKLLVRAVSEGIPEWEAWHDLGLSRSRQENYESAINAYQQAINQNTKDNNWIYSCEELRNCYDTLGKSDSDWYKKGIRYFERVIKKYPHRWIALHECGYLAWQNNEVREAMAYYYRAVDQKNDESWGWSTRDLFSCYMLLDSDEAYEYFIELTSKEPYAYFDELTTRHLRDWGAWHNLGWWQWNDKSKDINDAVISYNESIKLHPDGGWYWTWLDLGWCYDQLGLYEDAYNAFNRARRIDSENFQGWHGLGSSAYHLQKWQMARGAYSNAIIRNPDYLWSWYGLGQVYANQANEAPILAWYSFRKALRLNPEFPEAQDSINQLGRKPVAKLRGLLEEKMGFDEIVNLSWDIKNADTGELERQPKSAIIKKLLDYCIQRDKLDLLLDDLFRKRNDIISHPLKPVDIRA